jgi:hypothetical protein
VSLNVHGIINFLNFMTMLKSILELNGAQELNRDEQRSIEGGWINQGQCENAGGSWNCAPGFGCNCLFPFPKPVDKKK